MIQIDWSKAPEWANFHTVEPVLRGSDVGMGMWHQYEPTIDSHYEKWNNSGRMKFSESYDLTFDWKESLVERPDRAQNQ